MRPCQGRLGLPHSRPRRLYPLGLALILALLSSCATRVQPGPEIDLLRLLDPQALAYLRLEGEAGLGLAPALLPPEEGQSLAPLLKRSESLALALLPGGGGGAAPRFEAAFSGDYPRFSASLALGASKDWKKAKGIWKNAATGISAALPNARHILAASGDPSPLLGRLELPPPSPLPASLAELARAGSSLLVWLPRPLGGPEGEKGLFTMDLKLPLRGFLIAGAAVGGGGGTELGEGEDFELSLAFLMDDADSARIYAPAVRLAWYFICRGLFPGEEGLLGARFERSAELIAAGGLRVSAASLSAALARLASASP